MRLAALAILVAATATPSTCEYLAARTPTTAPTPGESPTPTSTATTFTLPGDSIDERALEAFRRYDTNNDDALSETEYVEGRWGELRFIRAPTDQEVAQAKQSYRERFRRWDIDGDGQMNIAEFTADFRDGLGP